MRTLKPVVAALGLGLGLCLASSLFVGACSASVTSPVAGQEYRIVGGAQQAVPAARVEVIEFFWYSCPHCNAFDPYLTDWVKSQGAKIEFKRVPVAFHPGDENLQKLYFALEVLGKVEQLHSKIFHAIHVEHLHLNDDNAIADFVAGQGVDRTAFLSAYQSFSVATSIQHARQLSANYQIDSVPMLVIGGRFVTSPSLAGVSLGDQPEINYYQASFKVADWLVAKAAR
ncbi:MAG TPA: thiol:disulfide interchange protein DsbA/DsbL [Burkholderiaceae bacterium]|jgi:thiol:disulfide interchange protein DsbA